jgi:mono/diheme cytochrome c family protein
MRRSVPFALAALAVLAACSGGAPSREPVRQYGLGHAATAEQIAKVDIDVGPDGVGLPAGSGSVAHGASLYATSCAQCHGPKGEGMPPAYPALIGRDPKGENFVFASDPKITKTIGNYWPYATTLFDYIRRAMPHNAPGSLQNDQIYALTAYLLSANAVVPANAVLDAKSLTAVKMPYANRFVRDDRRGGRDVK